MLKDKYKTAYKRLTYVFWIWAFCLGIILIGGQVLPKSVVGLLAIFMIVAHFTYLYFLGVVVNGVNRSFGNWVGGAFLFGPFGVVYTFFKFKLIAIQQGWA